MQKKLPVGFDNFKEIIENQYYYVDKTLILKELLDHHAKVTLFTRPRRFGKTLIQSMIRYYFELIEDETGEVISYKNLFTNLKISKTGEEYTKKLGKYPVINLSLKSAKQKDFQTSLNCMIDDIAREYKRHRYVLKSDKMLVEEKEKYREIMGQRTSYEKYVKSLLFLSECLADYHKEKVIILIDEYDVPLENAYFAGFYSECSYFLRSLLESALKDNECLEFAIITGCLRISRESIFTGLNNLEVISILNDSYGEYFGFTQHEVDKLLDNYDLTTQLEKVKKWYNGYLFGKTKVYNPWSLINYVKNAVKEKNVYPRPYWSNTSSNAIVKELIRQADSMAKAELEDLLQGKTIEKFIHEDVTYEDVYTLQDNLWNFLFFTGYLKKVSEKFEERKKRFILAIPNEEVACIYEDKISEWFEEQIKNSDLNKLYQALLAGDCKTLTEEISDLLLGTISYYDYAEDYYHGFLAGLLQYFPEYRVISNRESGKGRYDLAMCPRTIRRPVILLEFKVTKKANEMEKKCREALEQIERENYQADFEKQNYQKFIQYGICFCGKDCLVETNIKNKKETR